MHEGKRGSNVYFRFDGRALLDFVPEPVKHNNALPREEQELADELNFERYHDLVEAERLQGNKMS